MAYWRHRGHRDPSHHAARDHHFSVELDDLGTTPWHRDDLYRDHLFYWCRAPETEKNKALRRAFIGVGRSVKG